MSVLLVTPGHSISDRALPMARTAFYCSMTLHAKSRWLAQHACELSDIDKRSSVALPGGTLREEPAARMFRQAAEQC